MMRKREKGHGTIHLKQFIIIFSLVSKDNFALTKIICHRNLGNEFAFTHTAKITSVVLLSSLTFVTDI